MRQYRCHQGMSLLRPSTSVFYKPAIDCCLDAEWLDNTTFVTGGADSNIYVMKTDSAESIKKFRYLNFIFE